MDTQEKASSGADESVRQSDRRRAREHGQEYGWRERMLAHAEAEGEDHWLLGGRRFRSPRGAKGALFRNPFVGSMLTRRGGFLPLLVLHLIAKGHTYGNEIMRAIKDHTSGTWLGNPGAVYPMLRFLEREELIQGQWDDDSKRTRRGYLLTEKGQEEYAMLHELVKPGLEEALQVMNALYHELYGEGTGEGDL